MCVALAWQYLWPSACTTRLADTLQELMVRTPLTNVALKLELDWDCECEPVPEDDEDDVLDPFVRRMCEPLALLDASAEHVLGIAAAVPVTAAKVMVGAATIIAMSA